MIRIVAIALIGTLSYSSLAAACGYGIYVWILTSPQEETRQQAIEQLRQLGPHGLELALDRLDSLQTEFDEAKQRGDEDAIASLEAQLSYCREAIDLIAAQRDATVGRLYWYTDLVAAKAAAVESGKPILSLRLLGELIDEFSCANSRFFRTTIYANHQISEVLRENFVLHWQSERPAPRVTIDFGDGRRVERTVTGNSAHYLLAADGRPLDVLPGLYSPQWFLSWLQSSQQVHEGYTTADEEMGPLYLARVHADRLTQSAHDLERDLLQVGREVEETIDENVWQQISDLHRNDVKLDDASVRLIAAERPDAVDAGRVAIAKSIAENPILRIVRRFEDSIALDTVRNEYLLHRRVHEWFAKGEASADLEPLNERVYTELFLTPRSDPWLGLFPEDTYTALEDAGIRAGSAR